MRSSRPRRPRPPPSRARSGRCTTSCSTTRTRLGPSDLVGYAEQLGLDVERFTDDVAEPRRRGPDRRGRRQRRPQRRLRHADVLRQRPPPLRRLRHRDAVGRRSRRRRTDDRRKSVTYELPLHRGRSATTPKHGRTNEASRLETARYRWSTWCAAGEAAAHLALSLRRSDVGRVRTPLRPRRREGGAGDEQYRACPDCSGLR